ncbi:reverse transcriptase [Gossypium australe]|uniref:Reverse transcriptase n=1 Tax=Gossypium australe TaxID=47621 RepID=A0A5B6W2H4_9ROSI|nr:reverse transcriptase [Gossypium australe]
MGSWDLHDIGFKNGPMYLMLEEENDPLITLEEQPNAVKILSWNVRGLGRSRTVKRLKNKLRAINPRILFFMETKLSSKWMEAVRLKCGFENVIDIGALGSKGGLSLGWKGNSLIRLKSFSSFHINVEVCDNECDAFWRLMGFYGNPDERSRVESWELLRRLNHDQTTPWVVLGDFNEITNSFEKKKKVVV